LLHPNVAEEVLARAVSTGADFGEIYLEDQVAETITLRSNRIETVSPGRTHGAGIRIFVGTQAIYVYTNDTSREGLLACAEKAAAAVNGGSGCRPAPFNVTHAERPEEFRLLPTEVPAARKAEKLREANDAARAASEEIVQVQVHYLDRVQDVLICNTEGVFVTDRRVYTRMAVSAIASDGRENQSGSMSPGGLMGFEAFEKRIDPAHCGREAARQAVTMLHAPVCPSGVFPVVIDNGFGGVIFHEACGHSLEATSVAYGISEFSGRLGEMIAAPCVTAIDDGTILNEWGSLHVDDEGMPTGKLVLIDHGKLVNYMIDKLGSRRMNMPPTGSGRRQSYAWAPTSRMRNTYIAPGTDSEEEMIATMGEGLYAAHMGGGSVNPATGEFNFAVQEGYWVRDGKIAHPVRGASLIGRGSDVILKIDRVGKNCVQAQGMCGSSSGSLPVNVGQPMIRVSSLTVGGR